MSIVNPGSIGPVASRVADGDSYHVALDIEPILMTLLPDMARAIAQAHATGAFHYIGTHGPAHEYYVHCLATLTDALRARGATVVQLHPAAAERLSGELWDAKDEPDLCRWGEGECPSYADDGELFCPLHNAKADDVSARLRGAR